MRSENTSLEGTFEDLRDAIFRAYTAFTERDRDHDRMIGAAGNMRRMSEQERRQSALDSIENILDGHPFALFSAVHLELLELMIAYWREAEVEVGASWPAPVQ